MGFCTACGVELPNGARYCPACGTPSGEGTTKPVNPPVSHPATAESQTPQVETHLVKAILVTLFGCMPIGIIALIYASQVEPAVAKRDYRKAFQMSAQANKWATYGIYAAIVVSVISLILAIVFAVEVFGNLEKYVTYLFPQPHKW